MWCFAGSLDFSSEDLSGEGTSPLLPFTVGKAFISVKESVRGGFNWATEGNPIRAAATGKASSRGMRARRRGLSRKTAGQSLGQFSIARRSTRRYPPEARWPSAMARIRRRSSAVRPPQALITCLRSAGSAPEYAPPGSGIVVFPGNLRAGSIPASATLSPLPRAGFESPLPRQARGRYEPSLAGRCRAGTVSCDRRMATTDLRESRSCRRHPPSEDFRPVPLCQGALA